MFAKPVPGRTTSAAEGDVVVLLIGMRINHFRGVHHWLPVMAAMLRMLAQLRKNPGRGLLAHTLLTGSPRTYYVVQYWQSKQHLYRFAHDTGLLHPTAWARAEKAEARRKRHVGLWHEAYVVPQGSYECIYADMPPHGLGKAYGTLPLEQRGRTAAERFAHRPEGATP